MIVIIDGIAYRKSPTGKTLTRIETEEIEENKRKFLALFTSEELIEEVIKRNER